MDDFREGPPPSARDIAIQAEKNGGHYQPPQRTSEQITKRNAAQLGIGNLDTPAYERNETAFQKLAKRLHKIWKSSPLPPPSV